MKHHIKFLKSFLILCLKTITFIPTTISNHKSIINLKQLFMKFLKSGILIALLIGFTACSSDDDNNTKALDPSKLVGKWYFATMEGQEEAPTDCELSSYLEFFKNGKTYTVINTDSTTDGCVPLIDGEHEYELVSKDKIHFKLIGGSEDDEFDATILSFSSTVMILKDFVFPDTVIAFKKSQ